MRSKKATKESILEIAATIVKKQGLDKCTMRELSKSANLALGTLYNYFPSQKDMFLELFSYSWKNTIYKLEETKGLGIEERLKMFTLTLKEEVNARGGLGKMLIQDFSMQDHETGRPLLEALNDNFEDVVRQSSKHKNKTDDEIRLLSKMCLFSIFDSIEHKENMDIVISNLKEIII